MSKKLERIWRLISSFESKARSDSEDRHEKIKVLWQELKKSPNIARQLAQDELGKTQLELLVLQQDQIEYLMRSYQFLQRIAKRWLPSEMAELFGANSLPD